MSPAAFVRTSFSNFILITWKILWFNYGLEMVYYVKNDVRMT